MYSIPRLDKVDSKELRFAQRASRHKIERAFVNSDTLTHCIEFTTHLHATPLVLFTVRVSFGSYELCQCGRTYI